MRRCHNPWWDPEKDPTVGQAHWISKRWPQRLQDYWKANATQETVNKWRELFQDQRRQSSKYSRYYREKKRYTRDNQGNRRVGRGARPPRMNRSKAIWIRFLTQSPFYQGPVPYNLENFREIRRAQWLRHWKREPYKTDYNQFLKH